MNGDECTEILKEEMRAHDDKHQTLVLAVISCGRAILVLWHTAVKDKLKDNQTRIEKELLTDFRTIVPMDTKIVILADRGFGKIDLFEHLKSFYFDYVIRLKRNDYIYNKFYSGSLENWSSRRELFVISAQPCSLPGSGTRYA